MIESLTTLQTTGQSSSDNRHASAQNGFTIRAVFSEHKNDDTQRPSRIDIIDNTSAINRRLKSKERNMHTRNSKLRRTALEILSLPLEYVDEPQKLIHQATLSMLRDTENSAIYWQPDLINALTYNVIEKVMKPKKNIDVVRSGIGKVFVIGDTHGQFYDVLHLLRTVCLTFSILTYIS
jgi:hypothetical protein